MACPRGTSSLQVICGIVCVFCVLILIHQQLQLQKRGVKHHPSNAAKPPVNETVEEITVELTYGAMDACPSFPKLLQGDMDVDLTRASTDYVTLSNFAGEGEFLNNITNDSTVLGNPMKICNGSSPSMVVFRPKHCRPSETVAIIIPFRDRQEHLRFLLGHLIPILRRQLIRYSVFVVEQLGDGIFNKGRLMNTGFEYAASAGKIAHLPFDCFIFHDVDLLVEHDTLLYRCSKDGRITHLSVSVSKFKYKPLCCGMTVGGVLGFTEDQFRKVNGYPNAYWGWGGEDDDMNARISHQKFRIERANFVKGRYTMIKHERDTGNPLSEAVVNANVDTANTRFETDGISNLDTRIVAVKWFPLFTKLEVDVKNPNVTLD